MNIDSIRNGIVIDHIQAGKCMDIYRYLHLDQLECSVAIIKNATSHKMQRKDIIKIDTDLDVDLDVLGFIDPNISVNVIREGELVEKKHLTLPKRVRDLLVCKNPRCITSVEQGITQEFKLTNEHERIYRCIYCETKADK